MTDPLPSHEVPADVSAADWSLAVTGAVADPRRFDAPALDALPTETYTADFACVEGWVAADLTWEGLRVGTLIDRVAPDPDAAYALVSAMDGEYACGYSLDRLRRCVLARRLDGDPLPVEHGGPARLVPVGEGDCWESVKWVSAIEVRTSSPDAADTARDLALSRVE